MADNFNLINFKRGTLADLQALNTAANRSKIEIGTFYLTIDEGSNAPESTRLFIGREVPNPEGSGTIKKIVPVNQGIVKVSNVTSLNNNTVEGNFQAGDFAYVESGNIFAVYDGAAWKQINSVGTDTYINDIQTDISVTNNVATVAQTGIYNDSTVRPDMPFAGFKVAGDNGVTLSVTQGASSGAADTLTISGDEYAISHSSVSGNTNTVDIELTSTEENDSSISIKGGDNVTITTPNSGADDGKIVISADNKYVDALSFSSAATGFTATAIYNDNTDFSSTNALDPQIVLGTHTNSPIHFNNGVATLNVYTKDEIDQKQRELDAMTYKGTVGTNGTAAASVTAITNVHVGDTFKICSDGLTLTSTQSADGTGYDLKVGDVLIANGTESDSTGLITSGLVFDLIPAGDTDTTYELSGITHGVELSGSTTSTASGIGSFALAQGSQITLTDSGTNDKVVTVAHETITKLTNDTDTAVTQSEGVNQTIPVISDITLSNGHVTKWTIKNYTVVDTSIHLDSLAYTASVPTNTSASNYEKEATIQGAIGWSDQGNNPGVAVTGSFKVESDNLKVTAPTPTTTGVPEIKLNFVWGSF